MGLFDFLGGGNDYGAGGYSDSANKALGQANDITGYQGGIAQQYGQLANNNLSQYGALSNTATAANNAYDSYLSADPRTDQRFAELTAQGIGNGANNYARSSANNLTSAYRRGLDTPDSGGQSSVGASTQAYLNTQQALQQQQAKAAAANQLQAQYGQRLAQRSSFDNGLAGQAYSRGVGALGAQNGVYGQQIGEYSGIAGQYNGLAGQARQRQAADNAEIGGLIGTVAGAFGAGSVGAAAAAPSAVSSGYSPNEFTGDYSGYGGGVGSGYVNNTGQYFAPGESAYDTNPNDPYSYAM